MGLLGELLSRQLAERDLCKCAAPRWVPAVVAHGCQPILPSGGCGTASMMMQGEVDACTGADVEAGQDEAVEEVH